MTQFSFTRYTDDQGKFDPFGRPLAQTQIACPRGWRTLDSTPSEPYLATLTRTVYAEPTDPKVIGWRRPSPMKCSIPVADAYPN